MSWESDNLAKEVAIHSTGASIGSPRRLTLRERLTAQKEHLTRSLDDVNAAIKSLDDNPNVEQVIESVSKTGMIHV